MHAWMDACTRKGKKVPKGWKEIGREVRREILTVIWTEGGGERGGEGEKKESSREARRKQRGLETGRREEGLVCLGELCPSFTRSSSQPVDLTGIRTARCNMPTPNSRPCIRRWWVQSLPCALATISFGPANARAALPVTPSGRSRRPAPRWASTVKQVTIANH